MFVIGVVLINYGRFSAKMCRILFIESGKNLNTKGHHLLAQNSKIPKSTSVAHVLMLVEIMRFCV